MPPAVLRRVLRTLFPSEIAKGFSGGYAGLSNVMDVVRVSRDACLFVCLTPTRFQPHSAQLCPVQQAWQTADAVRMLVRDASLHSRKSHLSSEVCVIWLLSTNMYVSLLEVTCLPAFVFLEFMFLCVFVLEVLYV